MDKLYSVFDFVNLGNPKKCYYCGKEKETNRDHFYPKRLGGYLTVRSCFECNREKGGKTPEEWMWYCRKKINTAMYEHDFRAHDKYIRIVLSTRDLYERVKWSITPPELLNYDFDCNVRKTVQKHNKQFAALCKRYSNNSELGSVIKNMVIIK